MDSIVSTIRGVSFVNNKSALNELAQNNCTMPDIDRILYNIGTKTYPVTDPQTGKVKKDENGKVLRGEPVKVLATVVYFVDGTKVSVINSEHDGVEFVDHVLSDGSTIKVASNESKERGLIYAIVKRLVSKPDCCGRMGDSGLGRILHELVDGSYDTEIEQKELKIRRAKAKAVHEANEKAAKERGPKVRYSIAGTLERINKLLDKAETGDPAAKAAVAKVAEVFA